MPKRTKRYRIFIIPGLIGLGSVFFVMVVMALTPPPAKNLSAAFRWLQYSKGVSSAAIAAAYYDTINAPPTLAAWRAAYGFDGVDEAHAVYYNAADLGFGRDMHCREGADFIACVVGNYGLGPAGPEHIALRNAIYDVNILASVAMVYEKRDGNPDPYPGNVDNRVRFYVYDAAGNLTSAVPLDSEGEKNIPHMCLACHGGDASVDDADNPTTVTVDGANFLPFDPFTFGFSTEEGFTQSDQEEELRRLNALVYQTTPTSAISETIAAFYPAGVMNPGSTAVDGIPAYWTGSDEVMRNVVAPYCRTCHVAQINWPPTAGSLAGSSAFAAVYNGVYMPHAELTHKNFWRYGDAGTPAYFARELAGSGAVSIVNSAADAATGSCSPTCSLRDAINIAGGNGDYVITFDPDIEEPITLSLSAAVSETAAFGDLNLPPTTNRIMILGNGAQETIIDGGAIDRVFNIAPGAQVYIQALTIRGGATTESGGAIYNQGELILNDVILTENSAVNGGAIANDGQLSMDDSAVISNTAFIGAGIQNTGHFTLTASTISTNAGMGIFNSGTMTVTYATVTENEDAGLENYGGVVKMGSTALAGNGDVDCRGALLSTGYNLVQSAAECLLSGDTGSNIYGVSALLGPLETPPNGSTPSHLPLPGSPLLDAVPFETNPFAFISQADQHGILRPQRAQNDIGATERIAIEEMFVPAVSNGYISAPDLVVGSIAATADSFIVVIENQGNAPVAVPFWVDLYIDPTVAPTAVNQIWSDLGEEGLVWGVTDPISAGGTLTLTYTTNPLDHHPYFYATESKYSGELTPDTPVYVQVDSANLGVSSGAVLEGHEIDGGAYNNISSSTAVLTASYEPSAAMDAGMFWNFSSLPSRH